MTRRMARAADDDGFSLVESIVALVIAAIVFLALTGSLIAAVKSSLYGRQNQQATDFGTRALEAARQAGFGSLGHLDSDLSPSTDPRITTCSGGKCMDPGTGVPEKLHVVVGAAIPQHLQVVSSAQANKTTFTTATYVTEVPGEKVKLLLRVTVFTTWATGTTKHTRKLSTLVAAEQRGLPLPVFNAVATSSTSVSKAPGGTVVYAFSLLNQGAPDRWNLTLSGAGATKGWELFQDVDKDGSYTPGTDILLTDTSGDGVIDTGRIDPGASFAFLMVLPTDATDPTGTFDTVLTERSVADPTVSKNLTVTTTLSSVVTPASPSPTPSATAGSSPSPTPSVAPTTPGAVDCAFTGTAPTVVAPAATGKGTAYTPTVYVAHNAAGTGPTTTQATMPLNTASGYNTSLYAYSSDRTTSGGRLLDGTTATSGTAALALTDKNKFAEWRATMVRSTVGGTAYFRLNAASISGPLGSPTFGITLFRQTGTGTATAISYVTTTLSSTCTGFQEFYVSVPISSPVSLAKDDVLGVRVTNVGSTSVRLAYDVYNVYSTRLGIAVK